MTSSPTSKAPCRLAQGFYLAYRCPPRHHKLVTDAHRGRSTNAVVHG